MRNGTIEITKPNILLVEGKDEINFFEELLKTMTELSVQVIAYNGKNKLQGSVSAVLRSDAGKIIKALAIVRDDDKDDGDAFQSVQGILRRNNLPCPDQASGVDKNDTYRVGVWLMPDNQNKGTLETLCLQTLSSDLLACIDVYFQCLHSKNIAQKNADKSKIQAFLAAQNQEPTSLGLAAQQQCFDFSHKAFAPLVSFIQNVFEPSSETV